MNECGISSISVQGGPGFFLLKPSLPHRCVLTGLPAVVTLSPWRHDDVTYDGVALTEACRRLEQSGAAVVGLNCTRGPDTMIPVIKEIRNVCEVSM